MKERGSELPDIASRPPPTFPEQRTSPPSSSELLFLATKTNKENKYIL